MAAEIRALTDSSVGSVRPLRVTTAIGRSPQRGLWNTDDGHLSYALGTGDEILDVQ